MVQASRSISMRCSGSARHDRVDVELAADDAACAAFGAAVVVDFERHARLPQSVTRTRAIGGGGVWRRSTKSPSSCRKRR